MKQLISFNHLSYLLVLAGMIGSAAAQDRPLLVAKKTNETITIDGQMNEQVWKNSTPAHDFYQYFPNDTSASTGKTEVYITYDDKNVYFLAVCHDGAKGKYLTTSLRRDYRGGANDGISFLIDTYQDNSNAFIFGVNPFGVLREGLIANGGQTRGSYNLAWDNKWNGTAKIYDGYWIAEIAIPLKTLRFKDGSAEWNMNFYRIDTKLNERSTWAHIPRNNQIYDLAFMGVVQWEQPLRKPGANISVIPYVSGGVAKDFDPEITNNGVDYNGNIGGDVKIAMTPALNLDLTFNPDFSQVEVDRQVTNLSRFELFFPERRQFFLENADLFASSGEKNTRAFFSRRIGITRDTATGQNIQQKIIYGARLSGKLNKNLRLGVLNMQTARVDEADQPSINYSVAVLQQKLFSRSNISALFVNKENFQHGGLADSSFNYNRIAGLEYTLASANSVWDGKAYYHHSFDPGNPDKAYSYGSRITFNKRNYVITMRHQFVAENFNAEVGFVPRTGFQRIEPRLEFKFYPTSRHINRHGPSIQTEVLWDNLNQQTDHKYQLGYNIFFQNQSFLFTTFVEEFTLLKDDFDPTRSDGVQLPAASDYTYRYFSFFYRSDQRKKFFTDLRGSAGEYFNGNRYNIGGTINYRFQPLGIAAINFQYNRINLPSPYSSANIWLVGPRVDVTFTKSVFLTGLFQFNSQIDNFSTNIRFQWRYKPVSDLFIVYTDNYNTTNFSPKNRALVLKMTYWLNL